MLRIDSVEPGSYAAEIGLEAGDQLLRINGREINDILDFHLSIEAQQLLVEVLRPNDEVWELDLETLPGEDVGIEVEHPQPQQCGNQCVFCFVHQLPRGMRRSLYIKDEDYRFSYLYGSYITLTNLTEAEIERIIELQLSPLYVSVHAVDEDVRRTLLGRDAPHVQPRLKRLVDGAISMHCQVVLCPGYNDGAILAQTIEFLATMHEQILSLAVVPVGLTDHRKNLPQLRTLTREEARDTIKTIEQYQQRYLSEFGTRFVFPADELYLQAEIELPPTEVYEEFPQLENGIGLIAQFRQQAEEVLLDAESLDLERVSVATGRSFAPELQQFLQRLQVRTGVDLELFAPDNKFFGSSVTVTGLLTGSDLLNGLKGKDLGQALLLPDVVTRDNSMTLLDNVEIKQLEAELGVPVLVVESSPWGILEGLEQLADGGVEVVHCLE